MKMFQYEEENDVNGTTTTSKRGRRKNDEEEEGAAGSAAEEEDETSKNKRGRKSNDDEEEGAGSAAEEEDDEQSSSPTPKKRSKKKGANKASSESSPLKDRNTNEKGKPAEAGIIQEVYVENFMCHRKLSVKLCRNVNFIHGQNGSGKSAILAAIQVCLGAGARRTHRARNLKDLVRKEAGSECSGAKLRVTLLNRGADGYMPEVYGDTITVERSIALRSGGYNGYKLLDASGKEQSRAKKDLDAMLDQLNIQVENPVAVLDQEEAKKFLTGKAEDKYAFFTKATELERLDRCYASVFDNIVEQTEVGERARENIGGSIENTKKLKEEWDQFQELDKLEVKVQQLRASYGWSFHKEDNDDLEAAMKQAGKYGRGLEKVSAQLVEAEERSQVQDGEEEALNKQLAELTEEANGAAESKMKLEDELTSLRGPVKGKENERKLLARELAQEKKKHKSALKRLDNARRQIMETQGNAAEEERNRTRKIAAAETSLASAKEQVDPLKEQVSVHLREYQDIEPAVSQVKETKEGTEKQVHAVNQKLKQMQAESGDGRAALTVFGRHCTKLHDAVQKALRAKKFQGPVAGPVGMYVKVVNGKEKWAKIAEYAIGQGNLDKFIVTNQTDLTLMNKLRKESGCGPRDCSLYRISPRSTKNKYEVPAPPSGVELVTSVLNVENAMVWNFLVDSANIDLTALGESKESSEQALLVKNGNSCSIKGGKIRKVYFYPNGDFWECNKSGNLGMISNERGMKQTIGVDRSAAIETTKHELKALQQELNRNKEEEKGVTNEQYKHKKNWNDAKKSYAKVQTQIKKLEATLEELRAEADTSEEAPTIDTTEYETDIREAEEAVEDLKSKEAAVAQEIETLQPGVEEKTNQIDEISTRNQKIVDEIEKVEAKLEDIVKGNTRRLDAVLKVKAKKEQMEKAVNKQEEIVAEKKGKVANSLKSARKLHFVYIREKKIFELKQNNGGELPEGEDPKLEASESDLEDIEIVEVKESSKYYQTKTQNMVKKIEKEKEKRNLSESDPAVARDKYFRAKKDLDGKMKQINEIEANTKELKKDLKGRKARWRQFRGHISELTNLGFDEMLNKKGSSGEVEFDHESKQLNLTVQKSNTDESSQTRDVKALSGGERSFATLSLLIAIGESLETPFRVMDEFDVFLDPVARKIAMRNLVKVAQEMGHRQFIFITPQDVSDQPTGPKLRVIKMKPPVRKSTVGGPQQQTID